MKLPSKRNLFIFLTFLLVISIIRPTNAESPSYKIFTTEQGLAHDSIRKIVRDSHGFLWFCTSEGLSRFDGTRFTNFTQEQGLPHRRVNDFLELKDGTYLVGTSDGLVVFNPNGKPYRWNILESRLEKNSDEPPMFQNFIPQTDSPYRKNVYSLAQDADGTIWVGMQIGLYRVTKKDNELQFEEFAVDKNAEVSIHHLISYSKGGLIVVGDGLYHIFQDKVQKISDKGGYCAIEDRDGRILVSAGITIDGLRIFEFDGEHFLQTQSYNKKDGLVANTNIHSVFQTADGRIFLGGDNQGVLGLVEFLPNAKAGESKFRSLSNDSVLALSEDYAGNLWVGTEKKGAWQFARSGFVRFGEKEGINESADISSIFTNRDGEIFLTVQPNKLLHLTENGKFENILSTNQTARSWGWNFLDFEAHDGEWWIPSMAGLIRFPKVQNLTDLAQTKPKRIYKKTDGLWTDEAFELFEDSRGDIWISTCCYSATLSRWERQTDKIYSYSMETDGLPNANGAISFAEDSNGNIWLGHFFGKLVRYRNGKFETFGAKDGLAESQIGDLLLDSNRRLWIATSGYGLFRIDDTNAEKPVFTSISTREGLSSNQIMCLAQDRFGRIYAGTGHGINRIEQNSISKIFSQSDGLPGNFVTRCASDVKGNLWFVSQNILLRFSPELEKNELSPSVFIDKFSVNGVPQKISALGETEIYLSDLSSNQNQIEIDFFALTFGAGENIRYQYRLDNQDWSNPNQQQTLNLDLGTGQHFFEVRAVRSDGATSEKSATVSFKILPPIYLRWWFITICLILLVGIIFSFDRYRISNLRAINEALTETNRAEESLRKAKEERLAELEKVRNRIATDLHDDIGASLTQIAILSEVALAQSKGNGASESLTRITDVSNELVGTMSDIVWSINPSKDHLSDLTQRMRRFASDSLSAKAITFHFNFSEADKDIVVNSNIRREIFLIFKESINNIVKHSKAKKVEIKLGFKDKYIILQIQDNGKGFEMQPSFKDSLSSIQMGGNGILSMQKRAEEMNGEFEVLSEIGKGTTVNLRLPMEHSSVV
ncbi:MAG: hypothetical protein K1X72_02370 [Pyrinomonadaceae bacterium]|nr:hypothetical protein [Pyrinomonadaceae bacterium]